MPYEDLLFLLCVGLVILWVSNTVVLHKIRKKVARIEFILEEQFGEVK